MMPRSKRATRIATSMTYASILLPGVASRPTVGSITFVRQMGHQRLPTGTSILQTAHDVTGSPTTLLVEALHSGTGDMEAIGAPQPGHAAALSLISLLHSAHLTRAIGFTSRHSGVASGVPVVAGSRGVEAVEER